MSDSTPEPSAAATPLDQALSRERLDLANRALARLTDSDREIVVLYYRADESISAVAAALAIAEPAARKRLQRTRERLRDALAAVEASLRQTRPGPAFTVACVAALAAGRAVDASAAPTSAAKPALLLAASAVVLVGGAFALRVATHTSKATPAAAPAPLVAAAAGSASASATTGSSSPRAATTRELVEKISAADRAAVLARMRAKATPAMPPVQPRVYDFAGSKLDDLTMPKPPPNDRLLGKAQMRYAIKLMQPMLLACRTDTTPHGTIQVHLRLSGEDTTIVEYVEIPGDPPLSQDRELVECIRTTLETLELPPRDDATPWDVYYPFTL